MIGNPEDALAMVSSLFTLMAGFPVFIATAVYLQLHSGKDARLSVRESVLYPLDTLLGRDDDREPRLFHRPFPKRAEYKGGFVEPRREVVDRIREGFNHTNVQLLFGRAGVGKTTLATLFGLDWLETKNVERGYYCDIMTCRDNEPVFEVQKLLADSNVNDGTLVIVDNIHLNPRIARELYMERDRAARKRVYILLVGRPKELTWIRNLVTLVSKITDTDPSTFVKKKLSLSVIQTFDQVDSKALNRSLRTVLLTKEDFRLALQRIIIIFMNRENYVLSSHHETTLDVILSNIEQMVDESFWLLSFVLSGLRRVVKDEIDVRDLNSIDICEEVTAYYNSILDNFMQTSLSDDMKSRIDSDDYAAILFFGVLLTLAAFNMWEVPVPQAYVAENVTHNFVDRNDSKRFINYLWRYLEERGEVVKSVGGSTIPHVTLSQFLVQCYEEETRNILGVSKQEWGMTQQSIAFTRRSNIMRIDYHDAFGEIWFKLLKFNRVRDIPVHRLLTRALSYPNTPTQVFDYLEKNIEYTRTLPEEIRKRFLIRRAMGLNDWDSLSFFEDSDRYFLMFRRRLESGNLYILVVVGDWRGYVDDDMNVKEVLYKDMERFGIFLHQQPDRILFIDSGETKKHAVFNQVMIAAPFESWSNVRKWFRAT